MRNLSYMGRVVVKLIIVAVIAFVVITTAIFVINKYGQEKDSGKSSDGTAVVSQEEVDQTKKDDQTVVTLPGATDSTEKNKPVTTVDTNKETNANTSAKTDTVGGANSLPKTGPADTLLATIGVAMVVFAGSSYFVSRKAL